METKVPTLFFQPLPQQVVVMAANMQTLLGILVGRAGLGVGAGPPKLDHQRPTVGLEQPTKGMLAVAGTRTLVAGAGAQVEQEEMLGSKLVEMVALALHPRLLDRPLHGQAGAGVR
jgi:hypothetical protein